MKQPDFPLFRSKLFLPYCSALFGIGAFFAVLAFHFPFALTSAEIRTLYTEEFARMLLRIALIIGFITGTLAVLLNHSRKVALLGLTSTTVALFLGGATVQFEKIEHTQWSLGVDWFLLTLFFSVVIFVPLEHYFGLRSLSPLRPGWRTDAAYYFMSHLAIQFILIVAAFSSESVVNALAWQGLVTWTQALPLALQVFLAFVVADIAQSVSHRAYHRIKTLWRLHAVHHSARDLDWLAGSRVHFIETLLTRSLILIPLVLFGFPEEVFNLYVAIAGVQAVLVHANLKLNFGPLERILVFPRYHHWHHARHIDYWDRNYAIHFTFIDMLMGSYKLPKNGEWPEEYGVLKLETVPEGIVKQHLMVLHPDRKYDDYVGKNYGTHINPADGIALELLPDDSNSAYVEVNAGGQGRLKLPRRLARRTGVTEEGAE